MGVMRWLRGSEAGAPSIRGPLIWFAATGLVPLVLVGFAAVELMRRTGTDEAIEDAKRITRLAGQGIVEPAVTDALLRGDPGAVERVDRAVRERVLVDPVVRVKLWTQDGRIVYSDERRLIGARYELDEEDAESLERGGVHAEVSDLAGDENRFERPYGELLEVYLPIETPSGEPLLFESYMRFSSVAASGQQLWREFAPGLLGALLLLWLIQLPLAWRLACRLRENHRHREELLERALDASDRERRKIAHDLHDGVVQSLAGLSYSLSGDAERAPPEVADALRGAARETRTAIRELRSLLVEIYPPDLHRVGLTVALNDLVAQLEHREVEASVDVPLDLQLPAETEALFYRITQEALRNVVAHAGARHVAVSVRQDERRSTLVVEDDGLGFDTAADGRDGHFGLRMIDDATRDAGGTAQIESERGRGTRIRIEVPRP
jgi:two-component system NarL family sensor kinase